MSTLGNRLQELRKAKGVYQREMAALLDITLRAYQLYEADRGYPTVAGLIRLADYFEVPLDYLVGRSNNRGKIDSMHEHR
mgnify:CR=1 FL=1